MMKSKFKAKLRWKYSVAVSDVQFPVFDPKRPDHEAEPIFVIPATPAAYEAQVEAMAKGIMASGYRAAKAEYDIPGGIYQARKPEAADLKWYARHAKAALAAIGIKKPTKGNE